jgi:ATP-dependent Lon protease
MELPESVPVMTLPSATLFPQALLPLYIFEPRYRRMLADALDTTRMFSVAMQRPGRSREMPCPVAGLGLIRVSVGHNDGTSHLILQGLTRVQLRETVQYKPYRVQRIEPLAPAEADNVTVDALVAKVHELVEQRLDIAPFPSPFPIKKKGDDDPHKPTVFSKREVLNYLEQLPGADQVADLVTCALLTDAIERQTILETIEIEGRLKHLIHFLMAEISRRQKEPGK